jgi:hypothetical protein
VRKTILSEISRLQTENYKLRRQIEFTQMSECKELTPHKEHGSSSPSRILVRMREYIDEETKDKNILVEYQNELCGISVWVPVMDLSKLGVRMVCCKNIEKMPVNLDYEAEYQIESGENESIDGTELDEIVRLADLYERGVCEGSKS